MDFGITGLLDFNSIRNKNAGGINKILREAFENYHTLFYEYLLELQQSMNPTIQSSKER